MGSNLDLCGGRPVTSRVSRGCGQVSICCERTVRCLHCRRNVMDRMNMCSTFENSVLLVLDEAAEETSEEGTPHGDTA